MNRTLHISINVALAIIATALPLHAQSASSTISIRLVNRDGDTVLYNRSASSWRLGPVLSGTLHYNYGSIVTPITPDLPCNGYYNLNGGELGGGGLTAGVACDYQPAGSTWGLTLAANAYDSRTTTSYTPIPGAPVSTTFTVDNSIITRTTLRYVSLMPQIRYNIASQPGLHLLGGLDLDIKTSENMQRLTTHYDLERLDVVRNIPFEARKYRVGVSAGAGWDALAGVIDDYRMTLTPFMVFHAGSKIFSDNNSSWNTVYVQCGISVKFGIDDVNEEVIKRDPTRTEPPPPVIARSDDRFTVPPLESGGLFVATLLPKIPETSAATEVEKPTNPNPPSVPLKIPFSGRLVPNSAQTFGYNSPLDTDINPKLRGYLDVVSDYLLKNPSAELRIIGHSDSYGGTPLETQKVSDERALQVVRYLMRKGISRDRLLASGMGARTPIQNNRTSEGRAANRRIELTIVH